MDSQLSLFSFFKSLLVKSIFTVGLCTSGYWSLVKVHQVMFGGQEQAAKPAAEAVPSVASGSGRLTHDSPVHQLAQQTGFAAPVQPSAGAQPVVEVAAATQNGSDPTPTPAEESNASAESSTQASAQGLAQATEDQGNPYAIAPPIYPVPVFQNEPSGDSERTAASSSDRASAETGSLGGPMQGGMPAATPSGPVRGGVDISQSPGAVPEFKSNLTPTDIQWLLSSSMKASVPQTQYPVTGKAQDGSELPPDTTVSSTRWSLREGIKSEATFVIRPSSGAAPVVFDVQIKLLTSNQGVERPVQMTLRPFESLAKSEVVNGRPMRVFSFKVNDVSLGYENESAGYIQAQLAYEIQNGSYVLVGGSFGFVRKQVKTSTQVWDPTRQPASNDPWIVVDQLPVAIQLEKSP